MKAKILLIHFSHLNKKQKNFVKEKNTDGRPSVMCCYRRAIGYRRAGLDGHHTSF